MNHIEIVRNFIIENFLFGKNEKLGNDTSFLEDGIIDSTGILELIAFLEETFEIVVEDDEILPENLNSLTTIDEYLKRKIAEAQVRRNELP